MAESSETANDREESSETGRTREEIESETGGVVYTEHGRRYRVQVISNSGTDELTSL